MKKNVLIILIIVLFLVAPNRQVAAKNLVKIATIGVKSPHRNASRTAQQKTDAMNKFLGEQIAQVLPDHPDLIVFMGLYHGGMVQAEWAYSCRSWFVGSVGVGGVFSQIRNPFGKVITTASNHFNYTVSTVNLDYELAHLDHNKVHLIELKKKYQDKVTIYDPGEFGVVMITSEDDNSSAENMVKEFNFEKLDDYFNRTRSDRKKLLKEKKIIN